MSTVGRNVKYTWWAAKKFTTNKQLLYGPLVITSDDSQVSNKHITILCSYPNSYHIKILPENLTATHIISRSFMTAYDFYVFVYVYERCWQPRILIFTDFCMLGWSSIHISSNMALPIVLC